MLANHRSNQLGDSRIRCRMCGKKHRNLSEKFVAEESEHRANAEAVATTLVP
jgi:hypothetical protein